MSLVADAKVTDPAIEAAAHTVQLALTPVFLLSGVAALVNVFSTRLGRVSDQADKLAGQDHRAPGHDLKLGLLRWRSRALDWAVVLAALAGASTCGAALALFLRARLRRGFPGRLGCDSWAVGLTMTADIDAQTKVTQAAHLRH